MWFGKEHQVMHLDVGALKTLRPIGETVNFYFAIRAEAGQATVDLSLENL